MTTHRPDIPRPTPEAIAQHQELMHQLRQKKKLLNAAEYSLTKGEIEKREYEAVVDRIQKEYDKIMLDVKKIYKK